MGYRTYIGTMPKREYNKIKSMTREQLIKHYNLKESDDYYEGDNYIGMGVYDFGKRLYEFGKYTEFEPPKGSQKTFFKNKELNKEFTVDHDFAIVTPEFLEYIIDSYKKRVEDYYNKMMVPFFGEKEERYHRDKPSDFLNSVKVEYNYPNNKYEFDFSKITQEEQNALWDIIDHVRTMRFEWAQTKPYDLTEGDEVTTSWKYEYVIFELIRIYKTFDWKKNVMVYYGY
jgi:hypothetical protein